MTCFMCYLKRFPVLLALFLAATALLAAVVSRNLAYAALLSDCMRSCILSVYV